MFINFKQLCNMFICLLTCSSVIGTNIEDGVIVNNEDAAPSDDVATLIVGHPFRIKRDGDMENKMSLPGTFTTMCQFGSLCKSNQESNYGRVRRDADRSRARSRGSRRGTTSGNSRRSTNGRRRQSTNRSAGARRSSTTAKQISSSERTSTASGGGYSVPSPSKSKQNPQNAAGRKNADYGDYNGEGEKGNGLEFPIASSINYQYEENVRSQNNDFDYDYADGEDDGANRVLSSRTPEKNLKNGRNGNSRGFGRNGNNRRTPQDGGNNSKRRNGSNSSGSNGQNGRGGGITSECPGGSLDGCIFVCPSATATLYGACVRGCSRRCQTNPR